jgi:TRAP-type C4-dicarboxylate transport system permease small subunit
VAASVKKQVTSVRSASLGMVAGALVCFALTLLAKYFASQKSPTLDGSFVFYAVPLLITIAIATLTGLVPMAGWARGVYERLQTRRPVSGGQR